MLNPNWLFRRTKPALRTGRRRLVSDEVPAALYAIGDVHGCITELVQLEKMIVEDSSMLAGEKWLVMLGDYIDRGPASASVVAHLRSAAPEGFRRFCLAGNHEQLFIDALRDPRRTDEWFALGGDETARSYGLSPQRSARRAVSMLQALVPADDISWLEALPVSLSIPGWTFLHAGARIGSPLEQQRDYDLLWERLPAGAGRQPIVPETRLVHGHTPVSEPIEEAWRICIDTGAYATSRLTALRILGGQQTSFILTNSSANQYRSPQFAK